ncbi:SprT-like domain-containing protein [Microbacterium sp. 77mftsu3.1]|uniref:SprT-like domain-containing protein n=1 Tax=Microbacterium sp. 77mftsu3.1 TaxID=1761802 RepID=UPI0015A26234|nr:SprT-like domain-containing protein [Microbacterium sp. 77mftsu3.1]
MTISTDGTREAHRRRNGEFGTQDHSAPEVTLGGRDKTEQARVLARELMDEHGLTDWRIRIDNTTRRLGACDRSRKTILLSRQYITAGSAQQTRDTILHEIGHALAGPGEGHGQNWKSIVASIGGDPSRLAHAPEMQDARARRQEELIYASARPFRMGERIPIGSEVIVIEGQKYLLGMRASVLSVGTTRYLVETEDGQRFRAGREFFGRAPQDQDTGEA